MLTACGGSSDGSENSAAGLYDSYEVIAKGVSLAEINLVVGQVADRTQKESAIRTFAIWEREQNNYRHTTLLILVDGKAGVVRKTITGYLGNKTESFE